jgi:hypothetical protein
VKCEAVKHEVQVCRLIFEFELEMRKRRLLHCSAKKIKKVLSFPSCCFGSGVLLFVKPTFNNKSI